MSFSEFNRVKLNEALDFYNGKKRPKSNGDIPVYGGNGILDFCNDYNTEGDNIIIGRVGAYCGNVNYVRGKCWISDNAILTKSKSDFDSSFLYYVLVNENLHQHHIGSSQPLLTQGILKTIEINKPDYIEQKKIAELLSSLDKKIEVNNQINKTLENMAQAIFKQWFVDFEFPNEDGEAYQSSGGEMIESELGMIPKGWEVVEFINIVKIDTKTEKPFDNKDLLYEHYSIPALDANSYPCFEYGGGIKSNKYMVYEDSILISKLNPSTKRIWLPLCLSNRAICSTEFINFRPLDVNLKAFVYSIINSDRFTEYLMNHVTGSTGSRQRVKPSDTLKFKFVMPKHDIAIEFNRIIESIYKKTNNNLIENQNLKVLRDTLLPKLMSGEIRVPLDSEGEAS